MATISKPVSPGYRSIAPMLRTSAAVAVSPYNGTQQVYVWPGKLKVAEFTLPPLSQAEATNWLEFIADLNGPENTWNEDLSDAYPHESGLSSVAMRLVGTEQEWTVDTAMHYGLTFIGMEAK